MWEVEKFDGDAIVRETIDDKGDFFKKKFANNVENVVYNNQPHFKKPIQGNQNFSLDD